MDLIIVTNAKHVSDYKILLTFNTGEKKVVDLANKLDKPVFMPLRDIEEFKKFKLNPFTIEWECGADFSPEYLYRLANNYTKTTTNKG